MSLILFYFWVGNVEMKEMWLQTVSNKSRTDELKVERGDQLFFKREKWRWWGAGEDEVQWKIRLPLSFQSHFLVDRQSCLVFLLSLTYIFLRNFFFSRVQHQLRLRIAGVKRRGSGNNVWNVIGFKFLLFFFGSILPVFPESCSWRGWTEESRTKRDVNKFLKVSQSRRGALRKRGENIEMSQEKWVASERKLFRNESRRKRKEEVCGKELSQNVTPGRGKVYSWSKFHARIPQGKKSQEWKYKLLGSRFFSFSDERWNVCLGETVWWDDGRKSAQQQENERTNLMFWSKKLLLEVEEKEVFVG